MAYYCETGYETFDEDMGALGCLEYVLSRLVFPPDKYILAYIDEYSKKTNKKWRLTYYLKPLNNGTPTSELVVKIVKQLKDVIYFKRQAQFLVENDRFPCLNTKYGTFMFNNTYKTIDLVTRHPLQARGLENSTIDIPAKLTHDEKRATFFFYFDYEYKLVLAKLKFPDKFAEREKNLDQVTNQGKSMAESTVAYLDRLTPPDHYEKEADFSGSSNQRLNPARYSWLTSHYSAPNRQPLDNTRTVIKFNKKMMTEAEFGKFLNK